MKTNKIRAREIVTSIFGPDVDMLLYTNARRLEKHIEAALDEAEEREKSKKLLEALKLAENAFFKNWAIDWNDISKAIKEYEGEE